MIVRWFWGWNFDISAFLFCWVKSNLLIIKPTECSVWLFYDAKISTRARNKQDGNSRDNFYQPDFCTQKPERTFVILQYCNVCCTIFSLSTWNSLRCSHYHYDPSRFGLPHFIPFLLCSLFPGKWEEAHFFHWMFWRTMGTLTPSLINLWVHTQKGYKVQQRYLLSTKNVFIVLLHKLHCSAKSCLN